MEQESTVVKERESSLVIEQESTVVHPVVNCSAVYRPVYTRTSVFGVYTAKRHLARLASVILFV